MWRIGAMFILFGSLLSSRAVVTGPAVLTVGPLGKCGARFNRVQDALDAASPGDMIRVCAGVYEEQLHITKSINLLADHNAVTRPSTGAFNGASLSSGAALVSIILVENTSEVTLRGLTLDGVNAVPAACAPLFFGVTFQNASGIVDDLDVKNFRSRDSLSDCPSGTDVLVQSGNSDRSIVTVKRHRASKYQKKWMTVDGVGTDVTVFGNHETAAPSGIQFGLGAAATAERRHPFIDMRVMMSLSKTILRIQLK